jgi:hypothetical protein
MNIEALAADIAARVPELARDGAQNRQDIIARLIRSELVSATSSDPLNPWILKANAILKRELDQRNLIEIDHLREMEQPALHVNCHDCGNGTTYDGQKCSVCGGTGTVKLTRH